MTLDPTQLRSALEGLPAWQVEDHALVRGIPVADDSRRGLIEAIATVAHASSVPTEVHLQPDLVVLRLAAPAGVTPDAVELAARIDQVLVGSAPDRGAGTRRPGSGAV